MKSVPPKHGTSPLSRTLSRSECKCRLDYSRSRGPACFPQHEKHRGGGQLLSAQSHDSTQAETGGWGGGHNGAGRDEYMKTSRTAEREGGLLDRRYTTVRAHYSRFIMCAPPVSCAHACDATTKEKHELMKKKKKKMRRLAHPSGARAVSLSPAVSKGHVAFLATSVTVRFMGRPRPSAHGF